MRASSTDSKSFISVTQPPSTDASAAVSALVSFECPAAFDVAIYRTLHADLAHMSDDDLIEHYRECGEDEGRRASVVETRADFAGLVPHDVASLEIGPYFSPMLLGPQTKYLDVRSRDEMIARAAFEGFDGSTVPSIDYVSPDGDLALVGERFDAVFSSHCIEHQPNLIRHLLDVESVLREGGCYFVIVPDKRYCFDHFIAESTLANILQAKYEDRARHTLASVIEHRALTTHNDCLRHWEGDHGEYMGQCVARTESALAEFESARGDYIDVHAWYFTPRNAALLFPALFDLKFTSLRLERIYPTRRDELEFWMVLRKSSAT